MLAALITSLIRTASGYAVAWLLSLKLAGPVLAATGVDSATAKERISALLVFALGTAYYLAVRFLEQRWPQLGFLLGIPSKPTYTPLAAAPADAAPKGYVFIPPPAVANIPLAAAPATPDQPAAGTQPGAH